MNDTGLERKLTAPDEQLADLVDRERPRLRNFIRRRVPDPRDAEDILQDVFSALVEANRLLMPIEHITGWLFRVARNRITDLFRARTPERLELIARSTSPRRTVNDSASGCASATAV